MQQSAFATQTSASFQLPKIASIISGICLLIFSSCELEPVLVYEEEEAQVESSVQGYLDRFVYEARIRGLDVAYATSQVDVGIADIPKPNVIGQCAWSEGHSHAITLDEAYWNRANDLQREFVVFHELGHCVLGSDHRDYSDAYGNCGSIMTSGTSDCRVVYTQNNRTRLLDELFEN
jgi:hypothetical protein